MSNQTKLISLLEMIDAKIQHIEDMTADNRAVIIKLVKQSNQIVTFLKQIEIEDVTEDFADIGHDLVIGEDKERSNKMEELKELVEEYMDKAKDLKEFEEELKKHKEKLTPGTIGES
jgi:type II secretory pathway component GspD/PulD (secretin)